MLYPPSLSRLIEALRCLPGVGPKSAQRMAFHLLERERDGGREIAASVVGAMDKLGHCKRCRMFAEGEFCPVCSTPSRDRTLLCVVESPADVVAIEQSGGFRGCYFVLMGHLSPLDGVGPAEIGIDAFEKLLSEGEVREVILGVLREAPDVCKEPAPSVYLAGYGDFAVNFTVNGVAVRDCLVHVPAAADSAALVSSLSSCIAACPALTNRSSPCSSGSGPRRE